MGSRGWRLASRALASAAAAALVGGTATLLGVGVAGASLTSTLHVVTIAGNGSEGTTGSTGVASAAVLNDPTAVAVDNSIGSPDHGDVAIAEAGNYFTIRVIAGSTSTQFGMPMVKGHIYNVVSGERSTGVAFDKTGNLVFTNPGADRISRVLVSTGGSPTVIAGVSFSPPSAFTTVPATGTLATSAKIQPFGVAIDPSTGNILFTDHDGLGGKPAVRYLAETTGTYFGKVVTAGDVYTLTPTRTGYEALDGVAVDPLNGNVVFSVGYGTNGQVLDLDAKSAGTYYGVSATAATPVVIAGQPGVTNTAGAVSTSAEDAVAASSAVLNTPRGLFVDPSGNVLFVDGGDHAVRAVASTTTAGASVYGVSGPSGTVSGDIYTLAGTGGYATPTQGAIATSSGFGTLTGVTVPSGGDPIFSDEAHNEVDELGSPGAPTAAPHGVAAVGLGGGSVAVTWDPIVATSAGFTTPTDYTVSWYACTANGFCTGVAAGSLSIAAPTTDATVENLTAGELYSFTVTGSNSTGTSPATTPVYAITTGSAPGPITNLAESTSTTQMTVTWTPPATDGGDPVTGYTVALSPCTSNCTQALSGSTVTATFTGLTDGVTYAVAVAAANGEGTGPSSSISGEPSDVPGAPTLTSAVTGNGTVTLSWSTPASDGGSPITDYKVDQTGTTTIDTGSTKNRYQVGGLTNGRSYSFQVRAANSNGTGPLSTSVDATPATLPSAPPTVTATANGNGTVTLSWAPAATNGAPVTSYRISVTANGFSAGFPISTATPSTSYRIPAPDIVPGDTYTFTVQATNVEGTGPPTSSNQVVDKAAPSPPVTVTATVGLTAAKNPKITVRWELGNPNGSDIVSYGLIATPIGGGPSVTSVVLESTSTITTTGTITTGLQPDVTYDVVVAALYTTFLGTPRIGPASSPPAVVTTEGAPSPPTALTATSSLDGSGDVVLTWAAPAANGSAITGYTVTISGGVGTLTTHSSTTTFVVTGALLSPGGSYTFKVAATNGVGEGPVSTSSNAVTSITAPAAPAPPASAANTDGTVTLTWTAPAAYGAPVTSYTVTPTPSCKACSGLTVVGDPAATTTTVTGLTPGQAYSFTVEATNAAGTSLAGGPSDPATPKTAPDAPTKVKATATTTGHLVEVSWTDPASANGTTIAGYDLVATPTSGGTSTTVAVGAAETAGAIASLVPGTTYYVTVAATFTTVGGSAKVGQASGPPVVVTTAGVPGSPTDPMATSVLDGSGDVTLSWAAPPANGSAITGYTVTVSPACATSCTGTSPGATTTTSTIGGLTPGTVYTFTVRATNDVGSGPTSSPAITATSIAAPLAPTVSTSSAAAANSDGSVTLSWSEPPGGTDGTTITRYAVIPSPQCATCAGLVVVGAPPVTTATVTGLTPGKAYSFTVEATNAAGTSPASTASNAVTPKTAAGAPSPGAPSNVRATVALTGTTPEIGVTWSDAVTNGTIIDGYMLSATPVEGGTPVTAIVKGAMADLGTITSGLAPGATYDVTVKALYSTVGATTLTDTTPLGTLPAGPPSSPPVMVTTEAVPGAPTDLVATAASASGRATLTWQAPPANGSPVARYTVSATPACASCGGMVVSGAPPAAGTTLTGLTPGTLYTFTVTATNAVGAGAPSAPSNQIGAAGVPASPENVVAQPGDGRATVTWSSPFASFDPVTSYTVTAAPTDCGSSCPATVITTVTGNPPATTATVAGLQDGITYDVTVSATNAAGSGPASSPGVPVEPMAAQGYWIATAAGDVYAYGAATNYGSAAEFPLNRPIVDMAATPDHQGYWQVAGDGGIFTFGNAGFFGSMGGHPLDAPVVGMQPTGNGQGYWEVASDGGMFAFGNAGFFGSMGGHPLNSPIVGMVATQDGQGYWEVASDGGVFAFGNAGFFGSMGGKPLNKPIVGIVPTADSEGYWLIAADGGVFAFGDAGFFGSLGNETIASPIAGLAGTPSGLGYWLVSDDGVVFTEGDAVNQGSPAGAIPGQTVVAIVSSS